MAAHWFGRAKLDDPEPREDRRQRARQQELASHVVAELLDPIPGSGKRPPLPRSTFMSSSSGTPRRPARRRTGQFGNNPRCSAPSDDALHVPHVPRERHRLDPTEREYPSGALLFRRGDDVAERLDAWITWHGGGMPPRGTWKTVASELGTSPEALYQELAKRRAPRSVA